MRVKPDCVYVIPPNKDLSILHGVLHLFEPTIARGLRLPIDFFLRSLGSYLQERSIGVILSGMGSDGTLGIRAIKEHAISRCKSLPPIWIRMPSTRRAKGPISLTSLRKFLPSDYSVFLSKKETAIRFARRFARW